MAETGPPIVYDTGALLAAEVGNRRVWALHKEVGDDPIVTSPVLTQAWRGGPRQASLARFLKGCHISPPTEEIARYAGVLLGRTGTSDAVDAIVVATAFTYRASMIVTSDPDDIAALCGAARPVPTPMLYRV